jgi:hypothetical protein
MLAPPLKGINLNFYKEKKYNLAPQTITISSDPNYQALHSGPPNYQNL